MGRPETIVIKKIEQKLTNSKFFVVESPKIERHMKAVRRSFPFPKKKQVYSNLFSDL